MRTKENVDDEHDEDGKDDESTKDDDKRHDASENVPSLYDG